MARGLGLLLAAGVLPAQGQWLTQNITLNPGWNAVWLEVRPQPERCDEIFAGRPVEGVWKWNRILRTRQFETDPGLPLPGDPHWLTWAPSNQPSAFLNTLFGMEANCAYLIKVATNAAAFTLPVQGRVVPASVEWIPYKMNLVGLQVNPANPPHISEYFRHTPEVEALYGSAGRIFQVAASGAGLWLQNPTVYHSVPGRAYWVLAKNPGSYTGPIEVESGAVLDFGGQTVEREMTIRNVSKTNTTLTLTIRPRASEPAPADEPKVAGPVPLSWFRAGNIASNDFGWEVLDEAGISRALPPGAIWTLRWAVRRGDMAAFTAGGDAGAAYQSWLEIADSAGAYLARVPVTADNPVHQVARQNPQKTLYDPLVHPAQGLWVGDAVLDQVSAPYFSPTKLVSTPAPYTLRLVIHVDTNGQACLLQSVVMARTLVGATTNYAYQLYAAGDNLPEDATDTYRVSSAGFPMMQPVELGPAGDMESGTLTGQINVAFNDPLNPFLHVYQPMHDNKDANWVSYNGPVETYNIDRTISLAFEPLATNRSTRAIWGMDVAVGAYSETITGVRKESILVGGTFSLQRISQEGTLH